MTASTRIVLEMVGKDNTTRTFQDVEQRMNRLRERGERISQLGMRMSMAFTAPVLGLTALLAKNEQVAAAFKPVGDEFQKIVANLATGLMPVIRELVPELLKLLQTVNGWVTKFNALDTGTKKTIITIIGFVAVLGPVIAIVGQVIGTFGTLGSLIPGLGAAISGLGTTIAGIGTSATLALGPIGALVLAVSGLLALINSDFGQRGITALKQLLLLAGRAIFGDQAFLGAAQQAGMIGGRAMGGEVTMGHPVIVGERGPEIFNPGASGSITPNNRLGSSPVIVQLTYAPMFSAADQDELQNRLQPFIETAVRKIRK